SKLADMVISVSVWVKRDAALRPSATTAEFKRTRDSIRIEQNFQPFGVFAWPLEPQMDANHR
ncbi:MAG: hypothetical protein JAZ05_07455, partial [Candidatus Thiodiazotropha taylori]|nr:hypothetical protein [Candidatus Thiodiazotropha taylori]MCW4291852.1 hypothetical protein [Candidatus Thiodiazotropha taylori]